MFGNILDVLKIRVLVHCALNEESSLVAQFFAFAPPFCAQIQLSVGLLFRPSTVLSPLKQPLFSTVRRCLMVQKIK